LDAKRFERRRSELLAKTSPWSVRPLTVATSKVRWFVSIEATIGIMLIATQKTA
jgi:hypothetical protein